MYMHMSVLLDKMFTRMDNLKRHMKQQHCDDVTMERQKKFFFLFSCNEGPFRTSSDIIQHCNVFVVFLVYRLRPPPQPIPSLSYFLGGPPGNHNFYFAPRVVSVNSCSIHLATWRCCPILKPVKLRKFDPLCALRLLLLLSAGDIECNPGPMQCRHPCGVCFKPVTSRQHAVLCEVCCYWLHTKCIGMSKEEYSALQLSDEPWSCKNCQKEAMPFFNISNSDSIFDTFQGTTSSDTIFNSSQLHTNSNLNLNEAQTQIPISLPAEFISILYANCRSLLPKLDHLKVLVSVNTPHIISICETWLDDSISNDELHINGYSLTRRDRDRHGGGVAVYIHESITMSVRLIHPRIELLLVDLKLTWKTITCGLYYRPPSSDSSNLDELESTLEELPAPRLRNLLITGDFNIDLISSPYHPQLSSIQYKFGLKQAVTSPTRESATSTTLIDHIYVSEHLTNTSCSVQPPVPGSDHNSVLLRLKKTTIPPSKSHRRKIWLYKKADFDEANATLQCLSADSFPSEDVNILWSQWLDFFMNTMTQAIPSQVIKHRHSLPFLTKDLKKAVKRKLKLFKQAKLLKTKQTWSKYTSAQNKVLSALRSAKSNFLKSLADKLKSPRDFWSAYHSLSPQKNRVPAELKHDNSTATTSLEKANLLNRRFASCFTAPTTSSIPDKRPTSEHSISNIECTHEEVYRLLSSYKTNTASSPDGISSQMIRGTATAISPAITKIFNLSLKQSRVPDLWKVSNVTPIPKDGNLTSPCNYRPISLLSLISKVLERVVHTRMSKFLFSNKLLSNCQFGFRPRSSTQEALLSVTNDWHKLLEKHHQVATVFFDVKKAFDSVPHSQILSSLQTLGIHGPLLHWIKDYLSNRQQRVVLDGAMSDPVTVTSGVPQGSILGPLLFNIFMNSIANSTQQQSR